MIKKYNELIRKARDYHVIDDKALLLLGDSYEILSGAPEEKRTFDSVITDPPYEFASQGGKLFGRDKASFYEMRDQGLSDGFNLEILELLSGANSMMIFMHNDQVYKILGLLANPRTVLEPYNEDEMQYMPFQKDSYYEKAVIMSWNKTNPMPVANKNYQPDTELFIHFWRQPFFPQGELSEKKRHIYHPVGKSIYDHPTVKPKEIMDKCIVNGSSHGDTVIDPFCGSGSTGVSAIFNGRKFVGIEKDQKYFEIAKERLSAVSGVWQKSEDNQPSFFEV